MNIPEVNQQIPPSPTRSLIIRRYTLSLFIGGIGILVLVIIFWQTLLNTLVQSPHPIPNTKVQTKIQLQLVRLIAISANQTIPSQANLNIDTGGDAVKGVSLTMQYDPKSIAGVSLLPTALLKPANITKVVNSNGTITLNEMITGKQAINGNGTIATLLFSLQKNAEVSPQTTIKIAAAKVTSDKNITSNVTQRVDLNIPLVAPNEDAASPTTSNSLTDVQICPVGKNTATCSSSQCSDSGTIGDPSLYCIAANQPYCCEKKKVQSNLPANYHDNSDITCKNDGGVCARSGDTCGDEQQISTCTYDRPCCKPNNAATPTPLPQKLSEFYCRQNTLGSGHAQCKTSCVTGKETEISICSGGTVCCAVDPAENISCKQPNDFCYVNDKGIKPSSITEKNAPTYADFCRVNGEVYQCFPNQ